MTFLSLAIHILLFFTLIIIIIRIIITIISNIINFCFPPGGHHRRNKDNRGTIIAVSQIVSHSGYDQSRHPDIGIVKLAEPVKFTATVSPACLPDQGHIVTPGLNCYISGADASHILVMKPIFIYEHHHQVNVVCLIINTIHNSA